MAWRIGIFLLIPLGLVAAYVFIPGARDPINNTVSAVISKPSSAPTPIPDAIQSGIYVHRIPDSHASWRLGHLVGWDGPVVTSEDERAALAPPESAPTRQREVEVVSFSFPGTPSEILVARYATSATVFELETWRPLILDSFKDGSFPFTLALSRDVSIAGRPALETGYFDEKSVFLERYAAIGRDAYIVTARTTVDLWPRERDLLRTIIESFRASPRT